MQNPSAIDTNRLRQLRDALQAGLVERDLPIRLALLAILAGEHVLLLGPPGTAKSLVARRLHRAIKQGHYFERLLTRFSVPEELFGPLSLKALEQDRYDRQTDGYLPKASVAFLDEIFKANSAILNSMLTLLNEREFDNGSRRERTPLIGVVAASNELPDGTELNALLDRFLIRVHVSPVSREGFAALVGPSTGEALMPADEVRLESSELQDIKDVAAKVELPSDVLALLSDLREWCAAECIPVSDRRWRQVVGLLKTSAATNGRDAVSIWDGWLLQHCLWSRPEDQAKVAQWFAQRVAVSGEIRPGNVTRLVVALERRLERDRTNLSQKRDPLGRLVFQNDEGSEVVDKVMLGPNGEPTYLAPAQAQRCITPARWERLSDRTNGGRGYSRAELDQLRLDLPDEYVKFRSWEGREAYLNDLVNRFTHRASGRPVMVPSPQTRAHVDGLLSEVAKIEEGIEQYRLRLDQHRRTLEDQVLSHLWITQDFLAVARASLSSSSEAMASLFERVTALRNGIEALPIELPLVCDEGALREEVAA